MSATTWLALLLAAALEVGGDAVVRRGLRAGEVGWVVAGILVVGLYGLAVNLVPWDFSRLLGVYVAFFAVTSFVVGCVAFGERPPLLAWAGLALVVVGGILIQAAGSR